jgi:hypothetical protein
MMTARSFRWLVVAVCASLIASISSQALAAPISAADACSPPDHVLSSLDETAWRLFVAATCPVNSNQYPYVVWENWIEQQQLYPQNPASFSVPNTGASNPVHKLHGSPLAFIHSGQPTPPFDRCNPANMPPSNNPNLMVCEEVRLNGAAEDYVAGRSFWNRAGQTAVAAADGKFEFPKPSLEIKADWLVLDSCDSPPAGVHVEKIDGICYAMAGIHLESKLKDDWFFATFEPQNLTTNPSRCVELGCKDSWGAKPARTHGGANGDTQLTLKLANLMQQANLASEWTNYRLDGVQTRFVSDNRKPTLLGNSIIEGENAGVPLTQSSCITCHAVSSIKNDGTDGITLLTTNPIGRPQALPSSAWLRRDFVWSLSTACPNSPFQPCTGN